MDSLSANKWIDEVLSIIFIAFGKSDDLRNRLVFKGARILSFYLGDGRKSLDIDASFSVDYYGESNSVDDQKAILEDAVADALRNYFESENPVRFNLVRARAFRTPKTCHPRGWDGLRVEISVLDNKYSDVRNLPKVVIEISTPEPLGVGATTQVEVQGVTGITCYVLHRIAGEKCRAFLTSLPYYCNKMKRDKREHRVKDLHDLSRILAHRNIGDHVFWRSACNEFRLACESRLVDCLGLITFQEDWDQTQREYENDKSLSSIPFSRASEALIQIINYFDSLQVFPLNFPR